MKRIVRCKLCLFRAFLYNTMYLSVLGELVISLSTLLSTGAFIYQRGRGDRISTDSGGKFASNCTMDAYLSMGIPPILPPQKDIGFRQRRRDNCHISAWFRQAMTRYVAIGLLAWQTTCIYLYLYGLLPPLPAFFWLSQCCYDRP